MRWRFVEEELPAVARQLLLWVEFAPLAGQIERIERCVTGHRTGDGHWSINTRIKPDRVIAWMPVPDPPKAKRVLRRNRKGRK